MALSSWTRSPVDDVAEHCGYDAGRIARIEEHLAGLVAADKAGAASFALMRGGKILAHAHLGRRHFERDDPYGPEHWRSIASITKVVVSLAVLKLVEDGRIVLEFPVSHVLPEFAGPENAGLKIVHLLTHTSGIAADPGYFCEESPDHGIWRLFREADWLERLVALPRKSEPGAEWAYCSFGFTILAEIVRRVTGEPWKQWIEREILAPAGMSDSFFRIEDRPQDRFVFAAPHELERWEENRSRPDNPWQAMGGLFSTPADMLKLGRLFLQGGTVDGRRILGRRTIEAMLSVHVQVPAFHWGDRHPDMRYGLGICPARHALIRPGAVWGHEGASRADWWFDPSADFCAAWFLPTRLDWDPGFCWIPRAIAWSGLM